MVIALSSGLYLRSAPIEHGIDLEALVLVLGFSSSLPENTKREGTVFGAFGSGSRGKTMTSSEENSLIKRQFVPGAQTFRWPRDGEPGP